MSALGLLAAALVLSRMTSAPAPEDNGNAAAARHPLAEAITTVDDGCLEHPRVVESTEGWLGAPEVDARVRATVTADAPGSLRVRLYIDDSLSVDRLLDPSPSKCADRHAAVGLLIAMAIDQQLEAGQMPIPEAKLEPPPPTPTAPQAARTGTDDERAPRLEARRDNRAGRPRATEVSLYAGPMVGFELLPGVAFGGRLGISVEALSWLEVDIGALGLAGLPFELGVGEVAPALVGAEVALCPSRRWSRWQARLCLGPAAAAVIGRGRGFDEERTSTLPWVAVTAAPDVRLRLSRRVALGLRAGVSAPILSAQFDVRNDGGIVIDRRAPASAGGFAGIDVAIALRGVR